MDQIQTAHIRPHAWSVVALAFALALIVHITRTGTSGAAAVGGLFAACLAAGPSDGDSSIFYRSGLPALLVLFVLTTAATFFRRAQKMAMGLAEPKGGRTAAQVVPNLGAASMFAAAGGSTENAACRAAMIAGMVAALAEATADTLASELGETFHGRVRLITTWQQVPPGTDGGMSLKGTVVAILGAAIIVLICMPTMRLNLNDAAVCLLAAIIGLFIDSFLGATLEGRSYLTNNKVNFLSTVAAGFIAAAFIFWAPPTSGSVSQRPSTPRRPHSCHTLSRLVRSRAQPLRGPATSLRVGR